jgi:MFS transporter, PAT family, beta-lactamase induction signal transducer AmpG
MKKIFHPHLPALSENPVLRYISFSLLYLAQGIPHGIMYFGIPAWMAMKGKSVGEIATFAGVLGLPWSFKFVMAPLIDRYTYLPMGRRRPWVLFGQAGLLISFIALSMVPDPLNNLGILMAAGFCVSFFSAFQDVATDGMAIDIIPRDEQARANGLMWGSKTIGISASLAAGSWMLNRFSFSFAILTLAFSVGLIMLVPLLMRERPGEKFLPGMPGKTSPESEELHLDSWGEILRSILHVLTLPYSILLSVLLFVMGAAYNFMNTLIPIFTVKNLNWTDEEYSQVYSAASLFGGILGMFIGGYLIDHFGRIRMLSIYYLLLILLTGGMAYYEVHWLNSHFTTAFIFFYTTLYVFSTIGLLSIAMKFCWKKVSATQFTIYMAITNLGFSVGPGMIAPINEKYGWEFTILVFAIVVSGVLFILQFMRTKVHMHQLEDLEKQDMLIHDSVFKYQATS